MMVFFAFSRRAKAVTCLQCNPSKLASKLETKCAMSGQFYLHDNNGIRNVEKVVCVVLSEKGDTCT